MRLDFNVLWVDDQPRSVAAQIKAIAKRFEDEGFEFQPKLKTSVEELSDAIADDVFTDEIDLILVDWDLGAGWQGDDAIAKIRKRIPYKDVIFYSAKTSLVELRTDAFKADLEGVYCVTRPDLVEEVVGVFESLVKKVLDLDHTRGIVMGATADIDYTVNQCLKAVHGKLATRAQAALLVEALEKISGRLAELSAQVEKWKAEPDFAQMLEHHLVFTANDRLRMLQRLLKGKAQKGYKTHITRYMQEIVPERNILGHQVLTIEGKSTGVVDKNLRQVGVAKTRELRRTLLSLRAEFRSLLLALGE